MFGDLPPSSSVTRLIVCRRAGGDRAADLGRAGEGDLGHVGVLDQPLRRTSRPGPDDDVDDALGDARPRRASSAKRSAVSGVSSAGLSTTRVARRRAPAPSFHEAIVSGKFHGDDQPDHAERLAHGERLPARDRDRVARAAARARRRSSGTRRPPCPSRRARRRSACRRCAPRAVRAPRGARASVSASARSCARAVGGGTARHAGKRRRRARDGRVDLVDAGARELLRAPPRWRARGPARIAARSDALGRRVAASSHAAAAVHVELDACGSGP